MQKIYLRLLINDFKKNKLITMAVFVIMAVSAALMGLTVMLFSGLLGSIDSLMTKAETCDFLQMHSGEIDEKALVRFSESIDGVDKMQICNFLNVENSLIFINEKSLTDSTQDNGFCTQSPRFDYLLDMDNQIIEVKTGSVYVPVCYRSEYKVEAGQIMQIGNKKLVVAGFLRDSQMNSMMASSKRFLVSKDDYEDLKSFGSEEYLIEFKIKPGYDINEFATLYADALMPCNGPTITLILIKLMNAISDGMMIFVILLVSVVVLVISIICIRYIVLTSMEKNKKEAGMMKAIGIASKDIRHFYIRKYIMLSFAGAIAGIIAAFIISRPLGAQMRSLYGSDGNSFTTVLISFIGIIVTEALILAAIHRNLKKTEKISAVQALRGEKSGKKKNGYVFIAVIMAASVFLMLVPQNISSTISSEKFVSYMGIGNAQIRMDIRQIDDVKAVSSRLLERIKKDARINKYVIMQTKSLRAKLKDDKEVNLLVEEGNHSVFPLSYISGTAPVKKGEIAFSSLNASELNLQTGDTVYLNAYGKMEKYSVCGIYSDITNGGKTAKISGNAEDALNAQQNSPVMWSIIYVSLNGNEDVSGWINEYQSEGNAFSSVKIVDIKQYMDGTYGQTISRIKLASFVSVLAACIIVFIVVLLFVRLTIWQERNDNSLMKALGVSNKCIRKKYIKKTVVYVIAGIAAGIFLGIAVGQKLAGALLGMLGASGFRFILDYTLVFVLIPLEAVVVAMAAVRLSLNEIARIKPIEVALGRE